MGDNRSLDEFVGDAAAEAEAETAGPDEAGEDAEYAPSDADDGGDDGTDIEADETDIETDEAVTPTRTTYRWDRDGGVCASCRESVERRWWDESVDATDGESEERGGAFVCGDCKAW